MQFRNLTVPKGNNPVSIQFLAHDSVSKAVEKFLREHVIQFKELAVPLHLPTAKFVKLHHQNYQRCYRISRHLITLIMAMTVLIFLVVVHSCWIKFPHIFPVMYKDSLDFMLLFLWKIWFCRQSCGCCSLPTPTRPFSWPKKDFFTRFHAQVRSWSKYHGLPPIGDDFIEEFLETHWVLHTAQLQYAPRYTKQLVVRLKAWLPRSCIIHHADHESWGLQIHSFLPLSLFPRNIQNLEWQRFIWTFFRHGTRCYVGGFFCVVFKVAVRVPMGNSKGCEITNWVRLPEAEETVSQGSYSNFVFQVLLCCSHASYSTNHRLHVCTALATNLWSTFCSEYLAGHTWTFHSCLRRNHFWCY